MGTQSKSSLSPFDQLLDKNTSGAEKKLLSNKSTAKVGPSLYGDSMASPICAPPPSSSSPASSPSPLCCHSLLSGVVELAVRVMAECVEVEEAMREETRALVSPAPPDLVDVTDFECVLCTGSVLVVVVLVVHVDIIFLSFFGLLQAFV